MQPQNVHALALHLGEAPSGAPLGLPLGLSVAFAMLLGASGCVVVGDPDYKPPTRGDLTVYYNFGGISCDTAGVDAIVVDLRFPEGDIERYTTDCFTSPAGLTIANLRPGTYEVWISGYGYEGLLLYESAGWRTTTVVRGQDRGYDVAVPATVGDLSLNWTFFGNPSCIGVYEVRVTLEDPFGTLYDDSFYPCATGGVLYTNVISGDWYVWMDAFNSQGILLYKGEGVVEVLPNTSNVYDVDLN